MKSKKESSYNKFIRKLGKVPARYFAIGILLFVLALYGRTITYDYVYCDDNLFCLKYEKQNEDITNIYRSFTETLAYGSLYYRPILRITFIIENQIAGTEPYIYHLSNVLFHAVGSMLVFLLLIRLGYEKLPSLVMGLLFAAHPVLTPAATWISGRNDSLITIFMLLSFIYLIKYLDERKGKTTFYLIIHFFLLSISLFTKETAVIFPFVSIAYIYLFRKESLFEQKKYRLYAGWVILMIFWYIMRHIAIGGFESPDEVGFSPFFDKFPVIFSLLSKMIVPYRLAPLSDINTISVIIGIIAFAAILYFTFSSKKIDRRIVLFGGVWYVLFLLPSLAVRLFDDFFDYAEHRAYMLLIGFFIILLEILKSLNIDFRKKLTVSVAGILLIVFTAFSFVYQAKMENKYSFWLNIRKSFPKQQKAYIMLGEHYQKMDSLRIALLYFDRALKLGEPTYNLHVNTSAIYLKQKNYSQAVKHARQAVAMDSVGPTGFYNLAKALTGLGRHSEATSYFQKAIKSSNKEEWYIDLGNNYFYKEEYQKAAQTYESVINNITDKKNLGAIYSNLGSSYANLNENEKAEELFLKALETSSDTETALLNLVLFYSINKKEPEKAFYYANQMRQKGYNMPGHIAQLLNKLQNEIK